MTRATPVQAYGTADAPAKAGHAAVARLATLSREFAPDLGVVIHDNLEAVESEWRRFENIADCTAFQSFDWLATWHRHIGRPDGVRPVIVVGSYADGETAFILPLAIAGERGIKRLCWFGQEQCDYNAPLLARDFAERVSPERFLAAWRTLRQQMQRDPRLRHDWIELEKMPQMVGAQINPFLTLDVTANASGAHLTQLGDDWEKFYFAKRSSATRRRDRAKRRHMSEYGEVRFVTATEADDARRTLETLIDQKHRAFARRGIRDIFARPGLGEFFLDLASNPEIRHRFHISRVEVGDTWAAANFAILFGDCYYHVLASYEDDAAVSHYGPGALHLRELLAHAIKLGYAALRFHHRRRAVQGRMVRYQRKTLRSQRGGDLARLAGERGVDSAAPAQALRQANAVDLEAGLAPACHGRRAHASEGVAAVKRPQRQPRRQGAAATCGRLRHGRHGFVAANRGGRHPLRRGDAAGRALALLALRALAPALGRFFAKHRRAHSMRLNASPAPSANSRCCSMKKTRSFC